MFDDRVYKRGAPFPHALRLTVGDASFFAALATWVAEHTYGTVDTAQFVEHIVSRTTPDVRALADRWLNEPELPALPRPA
jgi:aminopeptidase N